MSTPPPSGPNYFGDHPYQAGAAIPPYIPRRGMVNQVRVVAVLNGVQGVLELLLAMLTLFLAAFFYALREQLMNDAFRHEADPESAVNFMTGLFLVIGIITLITGSLRMIACIRNFFFRSRTLGLVSLFLGLVTAFAGYCAPTSIAIAIYGLIVMFNSEATEAFEMGNQGRSADDILRAFNARPH
jgi:hypothetical protein